MDPKHAYAEKDEELIVHLAEDGKVIVMGPNDKKIEIIGVEDGVAIYPA